MKLLQEVILLLLLGRSSTLLVPNLPGGHHHPTLWIAVLTAASDGSLSEIDTLSLLTTLLISFRRVALAYFTSLFLLKGRKLRHPHSVLFIVYIYCFLLSIVSGKQDLALVPLQNYLGLDIDG